MAGEVWTAGDMIDALVTQYENDATLSALNPPLSIYDYDPTPDEIENDVLLVGFEANDDNEFAAIGSRREDQVVKLSCLLIVWRPVTAGGGAAKTARDRAEAILERLHVLGATACPQVGDQTTKFILNSRRLGQYASEIGAESVPVRVCKIEFAISYTARVSPGT